MPALKELPLKANELVERAFPTAKENVLKVQPGPTESPGGKPLQRFAGFLGNVMSDGRRKVFTTARLDEGVEVPQAAIRAYSESPENETDGLKRDVVWVDADADIFYFSTRPRPRRDSQGGSFPQGETGP